MLRDAVCGQAAHTGELSVTDWREGNAAGRALRVAQFREHCGGATLRDLVVPLFEPQILRMTRTGFVLRGFQYHANGDSVQEWMQEWWLRPTGVIQPRNATGSSCEPATRDHGYHSQENIS